jgi:hypothetical protein
MVNCKKREFSCSPLGVMCLQLGAPKKKICDGRKASCHHKNGGKLKIYWQHWLGLSSDSLSSPVQWECCHQQQHQFDHCSLSVGFQVGHQVQDFNFWA